MIAEEFHDLTTVFYLIPTQYVDTSMMYPMSSLESIDFSTG